jgi:hypothetical protein
MTGPNRTGVPGSDGCSRTAACTQKSNFGFHFRQPPPYHPGQLGAPRASTQPASKHAPRVVPIPDNRLGDGVDYTGGPPQHPPKHPYNGLGNELQRALGCPAQGLGSTDERLGARRVRKIVRKEGRDARWERLPRGAQGESAEASSPGDPKSVSFPSL